MSQHTPGPWNATMFQYGSLDGQIGVKDDNRSWVAYVHRRNGEPGKPDPESVANAALIAAAPEMLTALQGLVKKCRCRGTGKYTTVCTLCDDSTYDHYCNDREVECDSFTCVAARAAIAKAEGGAE